MALVHDTGDISVVTFGGVALLGLFDDVTYSVDETQVDGSALSRFGKCAQGTKLSGNFDCKVMDSKTSPTRVSHLDLTVFSLGGTDYLAVVRSISLKESFEGKQKAGLGSLFKRPQNIRKDFSAEIELDCADGTASAIMALMHSATASDRNVALSFTLNSIATTIPMRIQKVSHKGSRNDLQTLAISLMGRDPGASAYPTAPTGTTSLYEKFLNDFRTELSFTYTSKTSSGFSVTGNCIPASLAVEIQDEALLYYSYSFDSVGTVTNSAT
jgi:hypothetical protein